jgi:acetyl-CoA synthetase
LGTVGEPINPSAWAWLYHVIGGQRCPVVDTWWQTETGHIMIAPLPAVTTTKPGSATLPLPGISAGIFDEEGNELDEGQGQLVLKRPWPGMLRTLFEDDQRYVETYWENYGAPLYEVGDAARRDADGYFWIVGRTDDVINVSGHRLSTGEIEHALTSYRGVAEAAVAAKADEDKGQVVIAFVTLQDGQGSDELANALNEHIGQQIGKLARAERIIWASELPKTRSGKIMRRVLRNLAEGDDVGDTSTLADPDVVDDLQKKINQG